MRDPFNPPPQIKNTQTPNSARVLEFYDFVKPDTPACIAVVGTNSAEVGIHGARSVCPDPKHSTFNPQPSTLNPQPSTLKLQPATRILKSCVVEGCRRIKIQAHDASSARHEQCPRNPSRNIQLPQGPRDLGPAVFLLQGTVGSPAVVV